MLEVTITLPCSSEIIQQLKGVDNRDPFANHLYPQLIIALALDAYGFDPLDDENQVRISVLVNAWFKAAHGYSAGTTITFYHLVELMRGWLQAVLDVNVLGVALIELNACITANAGPLVTSTDSEETW